MTTTKAIHPTADIIRPRSDERWQAESRADDSWAAAAADAAHSRRLCVIVTYTVTSLLAVDDAAYLSQSSLTPTHPR